MFDLALFSQFHFLRPWWLLGLLPPLFSYAMLLHARDSVATWRKSIAPHLLEALVVQKGRSRLFNPVTLAMFASVMLVLALAGPSWQCRPSPFAEDEAPLVIALDVSETMNRTDIQPSRLERAKQKIHDLLALRQGSRSALIVYAGTAHGVIPLTNDPNVINHLLDAVSTGMMPRPGKFPEKVLPIADVMFRGSPAPGTLLVVADGIGAGTVQTFANYFATSNHQLLVWGVGTETWEGDRDPPGEFLPLEKDALREMASRAGGFWQPLTLDKTDAQRLFRRIDNYLAQVDNETRPWVDAGYYLLFPVMLLFLLWFRKGWTLHWVLLFAFLGATPQPAMAADRFLDWWLTPDQQGRYYFEKGEYQTAAERFRNPAWRAVAYYYAEKFQAAAELFARIETADGFFNLGNAWAHGQNYVPAVVAYNRALEIDPDHAGAQKNREIIQRIIDEINLMSQSQQPEPSETGGEPGEDEPQRAEGAERKDLGEQEIKQFNAEEILNNPEINEIWMRQIQQDPSRFLSLKLQIQLEQREKTPDTEKEQP